MSLDCKRHKPNPALHRMVAPQRHMAIRESEKGRHRCAEALGTVMKTCLIMAMLCVSGCASQNSLYSDSGPRPSALPQANWDNEDPEEFDWAKYVDDGMSNVEMRERAYYGAKVLRKRLNAVIANQRKQFEPDPAELELYDKAQTQWEKLADLEVELVAHQWSGGSGQQGAIHNARLELLRHRVLRLRELINR